MGSARGNGRKGRVGRMGEEWDGGRERELEMARGRGRGRGNGRGRERGERMCVV